jgi:hypothetical protein
MQPLGQLLGVALGGLGPLLRLRGRGGGAGRLLLAVSLAMLGQPGDRLRQTPQLAYSFLRRTGLSVA